MIDREKKAKEELGEEVKEDWKDEEGVKEKENANE